MTAETSPVDEALDYSPPHKASSLEGMPLAWIEPSPLNPRRRFDEESLAELAESLKTHGLMEPLVVRQVSERPDGSWRCIIIAGERRWRAAKLAGLTEVPVRLLEGIDERKHVELALLENLQRQDLDPLETAAGYKALQDLGYTQTQIAAAVKRSQPVVARTMSLLRLPKDVQERIGAGELTAAHGTFIASRFGVFPKVASAVAELAVAATMTTDQLQSMGGLWWQLTNRKVVRDVGYGTLFDKAVCETCPYGAYTHGHCLKPEHYDELQRAAEKAEKERTAAILLEAKAEGKKLPKLSTLNYGDYTRIYSPSSAPVGCSAQCPCRGHALDASDELVDICTDPKRYERLRKAEREEKERPEKEHYVADLARLTTAIDQVGEIGQRELVVILAAALALVDAPVARAAAARHAPELAGEKLATHEWRTSQFAHLEGLDPLAQIRFAVEAVLHKELHQRMVYGGGYTQTPLFDWYIDGKTPKGQRDRPNRPLIDVLGVMDAEAEAEVPS